MKIAYSIPAFIRSEEIYVNHDFSMFNNLLLSCQGDDDTVFVFYNQGCLSNDQLNTVLQNYNIKFHIIGNGVNVGIPKARQEIFQFVWSNYPNIPYQVELHLDMLLYPKWYIPITDYLDSNPQEPCMAPAIINGFGGYSHSSTNLYKIVGLRLDEGMAYLQNIKVDKIIKGFYHPIIHNSNILKEVGGIDLRFLKGGQGFEDYAILIAYYNYLGTKANWYPKSNGNTTVFHNLLTQRHTISDVKESIIINEEGLYHQFGAYGFKVLSKMLDDTEYTGKIYEYRVNKFINTQFQFS